MGSREGKPTVPLMAQTYANAVPVQKRKLPTMTAMPKLQGSNNDFNRDT